MVLGHDHTLQSPEAREQSSDVSGVIDSDSASARCLQTIIIGAKLAAVGRETARERLAHEPQERLDGLGAGQSGGELARQTEADVPAAFLFVMNG